MEVFAIIVVGKFVADRVAGSCVWTRPREVLYETYQNLSPRRPYARNTVVVLIGDDEYWRSIPAGRVPIRRDYLANLVLALDSLEPALIAIDFDLRSPLPDGSIVENPAYQEETQRLHEAIQKTSRRRPVVLPKTIRWVGEKDAFLGRQSHIHRIHRTPGRSAVDPAQFPHRGRETGGVPRLRRRERVQLRVPGIAERG